MRAHEEYITMGKHCKIYKTAQTKMVWTYWKAELWKNIQKSDHQNGTNRERRKTTEKTDLWGRRGSEDNGDNTVAYSGQKPEEMEEDFIGSQGPT